MQGLAFSAYWPYEPEFTRRSFRNTAANAKALGLTGAEIDTMLFFAVPLSSFEVIT
jgi:hypothetical protein